MFAVKIETPLKNMPTFTDPCIFFKEMIKVIFVIIILLIQLNLCGNNQRPLEAEGFVISSMKYLFDRLSSIIIFIHKNVNEIMI